MRRNLSSRDPHHGDMEHFQQEQPVLTSENKSQQGFGSEQNDKTVSPFCGSLKRPWKKYVPNHLPLILHRVQEITWIEWFCHLKDGGRPQKMVPFDARKMMFFFVPRISFENQSFPELVGRSIEKPSFYYKTDRPKTGWSGLGISNGLAMWWFGHVMVWPCDGLAMWWFGHVMVWPCDGFNQYSCLRYHL